MLLTNGAVIDADSLKLITGRVILGHDSANGVVLFLATDSSGAVKVVYA